MAETLLRGPAIEVGSLMDGRVEPFDGPGISYQGDAIPDPRVTPVNKDGLAPGLVPSFFNSPYFVLCDGVPQKTSTTVIAAAQQVTASLAMNLVTAQLGASGAGVCQLAVNVPILPQGTTTIAKVIALDFGFMTGTTVSASTTVTVLDTRQLYTGQWLVVAGAGNSSASAPLIAQIATIPTTTTITLSAAAGTGLSNTPIGQGNLYSQFLPPATQFGPSSSSATYATPYLVAGFAALFDPTQAITRNVTAVATTGATATILVNGYDIYGYQMTELLTLSGTTTIAGKKAFKYISSVVPQQSQAAGTTVSIGIGDVFGLNIRSDKWEYANIFYNGGFASTNAGWTSAVTTSATNTTGDVRGTINGSTLVSPIGTSANGTARLTLMMSVPLSQMINATPLNSISLFGVAQSTT